MRDIYPSQLQQLLDKGHEPVDLERLRNKALQSELQAQRVQIAQLRATILQQNSAKGNEVTNQLAGLGIGTCFLTIMPWVHACILAISTSPSYSSPTAVPSLSTSGMIGPIQTADCSATYISMPPATAFVNPGEC